MTAQLDAMKVQKKKYKSKYRAEHQKVCAAVKPFLQSIKELNFKSLWWLSQYVAHYKKVLAEKYPTVKSDFKAYSNWIYKVKVKADFGEFSAEVRS